MSKTNLENKQNWRHYLDWVFMIILLICVLYASIKGHYIDKEYHIVEVCNNQYQTDYTVNESEYLNFFPKLNTTIQNEE